MCWCRRGLGSLCWCRKGLGGLWQGGWLVSRLQSLEKFTGAYALEHICVWMRA
jgi:hypothetical protein